MQEFGTGAGFSGVNNQQFANPQLSRIAFALLDAFLPSCDGIAVEKTPRDSLDQNANFPSTNWPFSSI